MKTLLPKNSLHILPRDPRDFNLGAVFPQIKIEEVSNTDFVVANPLVIKDQRDSDLCSAYALTSVSEDQEEEELLPEYQFLKTKKISGKIKEWGADLRDACKSATDFGSLPLKGFEDKKGIARADIFKDQTWPDHADEVASRYKKETYFKVTGRYDVFDNIRTALWQHRKEKRSIITGALWRLSWLDSQNGIIPPIYEADGFGHAFKIYGQKIIAERLYLMAQLSQGDKVGDGGIFYLSREVVNQEIGRYGIFMFKDISREDAEKLLHIKKAPRRSFWDFISNLFKEPCLIS